MAQLANTCSSGTIGQAVYTLNSFFRYYYRLGYISSNPVDHIDPPGRKEKPIVRLTHDEVKRLFWKQEAVSSNPTSPTSKKGQHYADLFKLNLEFAPDLC